MLDAAAPVKNTPAWLKSTIKELSDTSWATEIYDENWNLIWLSDEMIEFIGPATDYGYSKHIFDVYRLPVWVSLTTKESQAKLLAKAIPYILYDTPDVLLPDEITESFVPEESPPVWSAAINLNDGSDSKVYCVSTRIYADNKFVGTARIYGSGLRASILNVLAKGDESMFERMSQLAAPGQRQAAIMFADLEASAALSRRLPSHVYWDLISNLIYEMSKIISSHNGLVGKHVGDGISAFFLSNEHGAKTSAARAAVVAAREINSVVLKVSMELAKNLGIPEIAECKMNIGIHWGDTIFIGQMSSAGRSDVIALGDEVNDAARIENVSRGGRILASKSLLERLDENDSEELNININRIAYEILSTMADPTSKANRDDINIPVAYI